MPYRYGHYWVGLVLLVTAAGFWASYFSLVGNVPIAFHVHAFTATSWLLLVIVQSVTIHRRMNAVHKVIGPASFVMFPLLIMGFVMIINVSAARFTAAESPFIAVLGPAFGLGMAIAIAAYLTLFFLALRHRRNVRLHAGYMLATPMILFESPFSRLMDQAFPWMNVIGSEGPRQVLDTIAISDALVAAFAVALYLADRRHGAPWLIAAGFASLQGVTMWFAPDVSALGRVFALYAQIPPALTLMAGVGLGGLAAYLGWMRGRTGPRTASAGSPAVSAP